MASIRDETHAWIFSTEYLACVPFWFMGWPRLFFGGDLNASLALRFPTGALNLEFRCDVVTKVALLAGMVDGAFS